MSHVYEGELASVLSAYLESRVWWTDERVAVLKTGWLAGETSGALARKLGTTRGAISGKVERLGLSNDSRRPRRALSQDPHAVRERERHREVRHAADLGLPPPPPLKPGRRPRRANTGEAAFGQRQSKTSSWALTAPAEATAPKPLPAPVLAPQSKPVTIVDLDMVHGCRWPLGQPGAPDFRYCGAERFTIDPGVSCYCDFHHRLSRR